MEDKGSKSIEKKKKEVENKLLEFKDLPIKEMYDKLDSQLNDLIIDIKNEDVDVILDYTSYVYFQLCFQLYSAELKELQNKLSKLYHKLKNLYFFNLMISLYRKINSIFHDIENKVNSINFNVSKDLILKSEYDYEKRKDPEYKSLRLNIKSTTIDKFEFLKTKLEAIYDKDNIFLSYDLLRGDFEEGYTLICKFNDKYLIINSSKLLKEESELLKQYGIESSGWYEDDSERKVRKPLNRMTDEEKEQNKKNEELKKINNEKLVKALMEEEKYIKIKFQRTKKNTKIYKHIFNRLKEIILSNEDFKEKIIKILPYGSVTQCTNTEKSDVEMTIITKNYSTAKIEDIKTFLQEILNKIKDNSEFEVHSEGIRETKRTILLLLKYKETDTEIEINCNNFFSCMNSNLIRTYLVYDARALILINTIKDWSKIKDINSNNKHSLSSYCYTLMTIYFLQRMTKPLLPILSSYNKLLKIKVSEKEYFIEKELLEYTELKSWHTENKEDTVSTLLLKWMIFYLYHFKEEDYCIDISNKRLTLRYNEAKYLTSSVRENKFSAYCFIDMFDYTYNPGSYMLDDTYEHRRFKDILKESIQQLLEGKQEFFRPSNLI